MKTSNKFIIYAAALLVLISLSLTHFMQRSIVQGVKFDQKTGSTVTENDMELTENIESESEENRKGPDEIYDEATGVNKFKPTQMQMIDLWKQVLSRHSESPAKDALYDTWSQLGPYSIQWGVNSKFNGRALDVEFEGLPSLRVGTASGGLWRYLVVGIVTLPIPMSDQITSLSIGAFATKPSDTNTVIVGTGEPATGLNGTGIWKTTDGGGSWTNIPIAPLPQHFFKIRYQPNNNNIVHAASNTGYFRSDNQGNSGTWVQRATGNVCDLAINPASNNIIYITKYGDGLYRSTDGGNTFNIVSSLGVSAADFGRGCVTISNSNPNFLYVQVCYYNGATRGIFRSTDNGVTWQDRSFRDGSNNLINFHWNQGNYNNCIAVSPVNQDIVLAGGGSLLRTSNGGLNWTESGFSPSIDLHADQHVIRWHSDGIHVYECSDGGVFYSNDAGQTFMSSANILPTAQFYNFSSAVLNNNLVIAGGLQDNMTAVTTNNGTQWKDYNGGDGWWAVVDKNNPVRIFAQWNSSFSLTSNSGINWVGAGTGLNTAQTVSNCEQDGYTGVTPYLYIGNGNRVMYSSDMGLNWLPFTSTTFNTNVWRVNASRFIGSTVVYAILWNNGSPNQNDILRVYDGGVWYDRAAGLPLTPIRYVAQHPRDINKAYVITEAYGSAQKVFKTTNRGVNWVNVTGDLPQINLTDLVPHPTNDNILYLASDPFGMWKTTNGGINWIRWDNGMPTANHVTRLDYIDSVSTSKFYVLACSYGRSCWIRDASTNDPVAINNNSNSVPGSYSLGQNYPNPFNPSTNIKFSIPQDDLVEIALYDIAGRKVQTVINQNMKAGEHQISFNGSSMASGVYFYKLTAGRFIQTKKMILIK